MSKKAVTHFKQVDTRMYILALRVTLGRLVKNQNYFEALAVSIMCQQLSTKAADTIIKRVWTLADKKGGRTPKIFLKLKPNALRACGLSFSKIQYIKNLAEHAQSGKLAGLENLRDEQVVTQLIQVKGIGKWTAEMFLIFTLHRPDVFSTGDLGLRNAIKKHYKLKDPVTEQKLLKLARVWSPYRSYASRLLWHSLDNQA